MTNNIDKERMLSSSDSQDRRMLVRFKENVVQLKEQIEKNEVEIGQIKDLISNLQVAKGGSNKDMTAKKWAEVAKQSDTNLLQCPANTIKRNNNADIQMADVIDKLPFDNPDGGVWKQGYPIKVKSHEDENNELKVFVVPHSHCDPGWIKTFEEYFNDQTSHILNLAVEKLIEYPSMRFVYAEMSYFNLWWKTLSSSNKHTVKKLLDEKRLEVVTGGWVMSDEANSHYFAMLDQLIEGSQWLFNQLDYRPRSGWSIDPFGHSPTMAYLLKGLGLKNMLIQRTHYAIKKHLSLDKKLEFHWRQNWDSEGTTDIFTHMMPFYSYDVPHTCGPDPKICCQFDFRRSHGNRFSCPWRINPMAITDENVEERARTLLDQYRKKATLYKNNVVLIPLGDDFRYEVPEEWDKQHNNYIKLFEYMNKQPSWNVEAKFATPSEYFDEVRRRDSRNSKPNNYNDNQNSQQTNLPSYPSLSGDFFVYADRDHHYWSGYFTSRPFYKRLDRELEHHQRTAELLFSIALATSRASNATTALEASDLMASMVQARRYLGLFQHHDAITGTSKSFVVDDYGGKLLESISALKRVVRASAEYLLLKDKSKFALDEVALDVDETRGHHSEIASATIVDLGAGGGGGGAGGGVRTVFFYNSLAHSRRSIVTVYVTWPHVEVRNHKGEVVESQVDPVWSPDAFLAISSTQFKLHFVAEVPALGMVGFKLKKVEADSNPMHHLSVIKAYNSQQQPTSTSPFVLQQDDRASIENEKVKVVISTSTGLAESFEWKEGGVERAMKVEFVKYGTTREKDRSGAYLFIPGGKATAVGELEPSFKITQGPLLQEAITSLALVQHSIRCYSVKAGVSSLGLDILNVVDIRGTSNTELAMRVQTDVDNKDGVFYTDLNAFQVIKRKYYSKLPIQANFYPMPALSYVQDSTSRFTLLTGQSLGVASLKPGWLEVMQDRRLDQDDNRGMEQDVRDNKRTPNRFRLFFESLAGPPEDSHHDFIGFMTFKSHFSSLDLLYPTYNLPLRADLARVSDSDYRDTYSSLKADLPCDFHLVNLRSLVDHGDEEAGVVLKVKPSLRSALILHRTSFNCGFEGVDVQAINCSHHLPMVSSLFSDRKATKISRTPFNLLDREEEEEEGGGMDTHNLSSISPMELAAFVLQFQ